MHKLKSQFFEYYNINNNDFIQKKWEKKYNLLLKWLNKTNKKENLNQDSGVIENYKLVEQFDNSERRGGVRKNSGAKKKNNARIKSSITLEPELKKWCTNQPEKLSKLVSEGLELLRLQKNK